MSLQPSYELDSSVNNLCASLYEGIDEEVQGKYERAQNIFALAAGALFVSFLIMTVVGAASYAQNQNISSQNGNLLAVGLIGMVATPVIALTGDCLLQKYWVERGAYAIVHNMT